MPFHSGSFSHTARGIFGQALAYVLIALVIAGGGLVWPTPAAGAAEAPEYEPEERASALARPALVQVEIRWSGVVNGAGVGEPDSGPSAPIEFSLRCSGFLVSTDGYLVTAGHCLDPVRARPYFLDRAASVVPTEARAALRAGLEASGRVQGIGSGADGGDRAVSIQWDQARPRFGAGADPETADVRDAQLIPSDTVPSNIGPSGVAVLRIQGSDLPALELGTDADVRRGRPVVALGYPGKVDEFDAAGLYPVDRWGTVLATAAGSKTAGPRRGAFVDVSAIATGATKGGPVVDMEGRVLGMSGLGPDGSEESFSVVPVSGIAEALRATGTQAGLGPRDRDYRAGLDHFYRGETEAAIAALERVVDGPARHDAVAFLARARDLQQLADQKGTGLPVLAVVMAVVGAGAAMLVIRSRAATRHPQPVNKLSRGNPEDIPL